MLLPAAILTFLVAAAVPALVLMTVWTVVAALRLLFPEQPLPFLRAEAPPLPGTVRVGARDIAARERVLEGEGPYCYRGAPTATLPEAWVDDVYERRN